MRFLLFLGLLIGGVIPASLIAGVLTLTVVGFVVMAISGGSPGGSPDFPLSPVGAIAMAVAFIGTLVFTIRIAVQMGKGLHQRICA